VFHTLNKKSRTMAICSSDWNIGAWPTPGISAESDLLTRDTWQQMGACGPQAQLAEIPGVGHAPMFQSDEQIAIVRDFLLSV
jgi:pimeloyl-ACP methyl ester carboxylesterase